MAIDNSKFQYGRRVVQSIREAIWEASRVEGSDQILVDNDVVIGCLVSALAMQAAEGKFEHRNLEQLASDIHENFLIQVRYYQKEHGDTLTKNTFRKQ